MNKGLINQSMATVKCNNSKRNSKYTNVIKLTLNLPENNENNPCVRH